MPWVKQNCHGEGCTTWASYGVKGTNKREFCRRHAWPGMVDLVSMMCVHPRCTKQASYGVAGSTTREFCAGHATEGTVCLRGKNRGAQKTSAQEKSARRSGPKDSSNTALSSSLKQPSVSQLPWRARDGCRHRRCTTWPSYGVAGSSTREFCAKHAKKGMENVIGRPGKGSTKAAAPAPLKRHSSASQPPRRARGRCRHRGCTTWPSFGVPGSTTREFCARHAEKGMKNVINKSHAKNPTKTAAPTYTEMSVAGGGGGVKLKIEWDEDGAREGGGEEQAASQASFAEVGVFTRLIKKRRGRSWEMH